MTYAVRRRLYLLQDSGLTISKSELQDEGAKRRTARAVIVEVHSHEEQNHAGGSQTSGNKEGRHEGSCDKENSDKRKFGGLIGVKEFRSNERTDKETSDKEFSDEESRDKETIYKEIPGEKSTDQEFSIHFTNV